MAAMELNRRKTVSIAALFILYEYINKQRQHTVQQMITVFGEIKEKPCIVCRNTVPLPL